MTKRYIWGFGLFSGAVISLIVGGVLFPIGLAVVSVLAGNEYLDMVKAKGMNPSTRIVRSMIIAFIVVAALPGIPGVHLPWNFSLVHFPILLTIGICCSFYRLLFRTEQPPATIADIATTILGFIYVGFLPSHLELLRNLTPLNEPLAANPFHQPGLAYVWASGFTVWATDVFAYFGGKRWGKRLLYPQVSPKKTLEGALTGFFASVICATVVVYLADNVCFVTEHPFQGKLWQAPLMGAVVSIASQLGDLCESLLKRDAGFKDSSQKIPGHGGYLDRGDSIIFGGAISYYWICLVVLGIL